RVQRGRSAKGGASGPSPGFADNTAGVAPAPGRPMKKSIGDNMFQKDWSFEQGLALVKKAGFEGIELWLGHDPRFQVETSDAAVGEVRRQIRETGLLVSLAFNSLAWALPPSSPNTRLSGD